MNDKQFEAFLKVMQNIAENIEFIAVQSENIFSQLAEIRADYETVNRLPTDEETLDDFMEAIHAIKNKQEKPDEGTNLGGIE